MTFGFFKMFFLPLIGLLLFASTALAAPPYDIDAAVVGGGECTDIGTWNGTTKTCTLNQDVAVSGAGINILSADTTLDGAGHTLTGNNTNIGVFASTLSGVVVRNIRVVRFFAGIEFYIVDNGSIENSEVASTSVGIWLLSPSAALSTDSNHVHGNRLTANSTAIYVSGDGSDLNLVEKNIVSQGGGISVADGDLNWVKLNTVSGAANGVEVYNGAQGNSISSNSLISNTNGLGLSNASFNSVWNNNFLGNSAQLVVTGTSVSNSFNRSAPEGGNYYDVYSKPSQGCFDANDDRFCDAGYTAPSGVTDNLPQARRTYYFTWYDEVSPGARNWILMTNPIDPGQHPSEMISFDAWFDLLIAGQARALPASVAGDMRGQVVPGGSITPEYPGVMGGPVEVGYHARMKQMVSQRTLWGDSLEEVTGTDSVELSDHYYWSWYDMLSTGYQNWVLIGNPNDSSIYYEIRIGGNVPAGPGSTGTLAPDAQTTPTFAGVMNGPVEAQAWTDATKTTPAKIIASQRVLSNNGSAFNEVPGIAADDLNSDYFWTWYDATPGMARDWIVIANPPGDAATNLYYQVHIAGQLRSDGSFHPEESCKGPIPDNASETPEFPVYGAGAVQVKTYSDAACTTAADSIASQRVAWGPSFEEVPGYPNALSQNYYWTWYDQLSLGVTNWVLVANPAGSGYVAGFQIKIGGTLMDLDTATPGQQDGFLYPGDIEQYTFPNVINGPVQVVADNDVIASQRVLWKGHFNEVMGTVLD